MKSKKNYDSQSQPSTVPKDTWTKLIGNQSMGDSWYLKWGKCGRIAELQNQNYTPSMKINSSTWYVSNGNPMGIRQDVRCKKMPNCANGTNEAWRWSLICCTLFQTPCENWLKSWKANQNKSTRKTQNPPFLSNERVPREYCADCADCTKKVSPLACHTIIPAGYSSRHVDACS